LCAFVAFGDALVRVLALDLLSAMNSSPGCIPAATAVSLSGGRPHRHRRAVADVASSPKNSSVAAT
jgi:hypothetical protein